MIKKIFKTVIVLFLIQIIFPTELHSQSAPDFIWSNNFGGTGYDGAVDIITDNSGNIIATGYFEGTILFGDFELTSQGFQDIFLVKLNSAGEVIWASSGGASEFENSYGVTVDNLNNIIITGTFTGRIFFDSLTVLSNGNADIFVAKYSPDGSIQWLINYGEEGGYEYGYDVVTDNLNNILVTGVSQNFGSVPLPFLILVLKFNPQGILQWSNTPGGLNGNNSGYGIAVNSNNDVFVTGCAAESVDFSGTIISADPGGDIFLAKYSSTGIFNWVKQAGFNNNNDQGGAVAIDKDNNIFIAGHFREGALFGDSILSPFGESDLFVAKFDQDGNFIWVSQDSLQHDSYGTKISLDAAGNIMAASDYFEAQIESSNILILRLSKNGDILWNKLIATSPSEGFSGGIANDSNGDIIMAGSYFNLLAQNRDIIIGKLPAPLLIASSNSLNFGAVEVGGISSNTLTLSNTSSADLFLLNVVLTGIDADNFIIPDVIPQTILSQQTINIDIDFSPLTEGLKNAYLIVESDAPSTPDTISLTGIGGQQTLSFSPDSLEFGNIDISDSLDMDLLISNLSLVDIFIESFQLTNNEFQLVNPVVPDTIQSGDSRILTIRFNPTGPGLRTGYLVITGNSASSPDSVYLHGVGEFSSLTFSPDSLNFGIIDVNNFSELTLTVINESLNDLTISEVFISGIDQNEFSLVNIPQIPVTIQAGNLLNLYVRFSPLSAGAKSSSLVIISNSSSSPDSITVTGTGAELIIVNLPESRLIGQGIEINIISPGASFTSNQFFYKKTGENIYQEGQLTLSGNNYSVNIPPEYSTIRGIQFYVLFIDPVEGVTISYPSNNPVFNPASLQVQIPVLNFPLPVKQNKYQMVSIPLNLSDPLLSSVLEDDYGFYDNKVWRLFRWNTIDELYLEYNNITDDFQPYRAFWLINRNGKLFNIENALSVSASNPYTINLQPGWNQIANPYAFPVAWDNEIPDSLIQTPVRWNPDDQDYDYDQVILFPWEGYFVWNNSNQVINLNIQPVESLAGNLDKNIFKSFSSNGFIIQIKSRLELTDILDYRNYVGMQSSASDSYDKFDIFEAPPITDDLRLSILSEGKRYARNIVSLSSEGAYWDIKISSNRSNKNVNLFFEEIVPLSGNFNIYLLDMDKRLSIPEINKTAVINMGNSNEKIFRLIIGSADYAKSVSEDISLLPEQYVLFQNFPNPFNPETNLYYTLRENGLVTIEIFDILGRSIKKLLNKDFQNAGLNFVKWDGTNFYGNRVSSGIYIYRIEVNEFVDNKKMILLK